MTESLRQARSKFKNKFNKKKKFKIKGVSTQNKKRILQQLKKYIFPQNVLENYKTFFSNKSIFNEKIKNGY